MDNHPIPQDVTGFQFRLIGNMTVKQFGYVAIGAVSAVIIYYLPLFILIKIVLIPLFILGGVALAFLPVEGRPIDIMLVNFFKALFSPNQFLYQKAGGHLLLSTLHLDVKTISQTAGQATGRTKTPKGSLQREQEERQQQLSAYLNSLHDNTQAINDKESQRLAALFGSPPPQPAALPPSPPAQPKAVNPKERTDGQPATPPSSDTAARIMEDREKIAQENTLLQQVNDELVRTKAQEQQARGAAEAGLHTKVLELENKLSEILSLKQQLEKELAALYSESSQASTSLPEAPQSSAPQPATNPAQQISTPQPKADRPLAETADFPSLPDSPNILLGVVKDSRGNILPRILVEVTDAQGNPVRAFKTNQLGQFMSATQLKSGEYTISFEDPKNQYTFDPVKLTVTDEILPPITITAHDAREELRKALFA